MSNTLYPYRSLQQTLSLLEVHRLDKYLFLSEKRGGEGRLFGGQVLGQCMNAALRTVDQGWQCHSMHGYFLRPGRVDIPVIYRVEPSRDGRSFATRRVTGEQDGKIIFSCGISFHKEEEGLHHQMDAPEVPGPEGLESWQQRWARGHEIDPKRYPGTSLPPVEIRECWPRDLINPAAGEPRAAFWFKTTEAMTDSTIDHQTMLAYASDLTLLGCAVMAHPYDPDSPEMQCASLDHGLWFHRPFRVDEWLLYYQDSPFSGGARGLSRGSFYTQSGELVASAVQESLIRLVKPSQD